MRGHPGIGLPGLRRKARLIRMQQCADGWHLTDEPERAQPDDDLDDQAGDLDDEDQADDEDESGKRV